MWSLLDAKGTQTMMKSVLGEASQLADYDTVKNRMKSSRYTMDFCNGVRFDMAVKMSDTMTAATCATLMKGVQMLRKAAGNAAGEDGAGRDDDRFGLGHAEGCVLVVGQPVCESVDVAAVPVGGEVRIRQRFSAGSSLD